MRSSRPIHPNFQYWLDMKEQYLIELFCDLRQFILSVYPDSNEILYHTHALATVFSISEKMSDAFCVVPVYTNHLNLGFNKGTVLNDCDNLLVGIGKLMRHVPIQKPEDYRNAQIKMLLQDAINFTISDTEEPITTRGKTVSKIKIE
ncbi:DUF1801 domain-containing protein [Fulvivirga lutea]|uniref:DUF1801 domain-containing protein n=1 Tax=Fulvivirga lutea TaxID=2810512 RepID=A0A975A1Q1_9BACT|nr:DUF1801 domain-containing protein [Fulvivirga lutea]QSE98664.1 DUF1801 domain-containing protein [Fulvivirga lutea]